MPITIAQVELGAPLRALRSTIAGGRESRARVLVRLHREPLGFVDIRLPATGLEPNELARSIWAAVAEPAAVHLKQDLIDVPESLGPDGLCWTSDVLCETDRRRTLLACPKITVVVATCNRAESLARCIESLDRLDYPSFDVVVVENGASERDTVQLVKHFENRLQITYRHEPLQGLAMAHNTGIKHASGEYIAFTDDDVVVDPSWLVEIARAFGHDADIGCVTGLILPDQLSTESQSWFEDALGVNKGFAAVVFDPSGGETSGLYPYAAGIFGSGANMAFRARTLRRIRGFDPATGAGTLSRGGDDLGAFFDVVAAGERIAYQPSALVWHRHWDSSDMLPSRMFGYGAGLGAYLAKTVSDKPSRLLSIAWRLPAGVRHLLRREHTQQRLEDFPLSRKLVWFHRAGMAYGPFAYGVERARRRHIRRPVSAP